MLAFSSCVSHPELLNFNEGQEFPNAPVNIPNIPALRIQPDDVLQIRVFTEDMRLATPFNIMAGGNNTNQSTGTFGYLVDAAGIIDFPILGRLKMGGLTIPEARELVTTRLLDQLNNPIVNLRLANLKVTVLGEVGRPGTFSLPDEKTTILEAIGLAGDLTIYGNRENILIIREQNGEREFARINLHQRNIFESPYFYLRQNDVIYIEPRKEKTASIADRSRQILPWISMVASLTSIVLALSRF